MAKYSSKPTSVPFGIEQLFSKFDDLTVLQTMLDKLPQEQREKVGEVQFDKDSISIQTKQVGEIKFVVKERVRPNKVVFGTQQSPVPLTLTADFKSDGDNKTIVTAETEVDIPAMLKPMVGPAMQKATDQFGDLISQLARISG